MNRLLIWFNSEGDGRDDMIWTDKFNGDARVWINAGMQDERISGSIFKWDKNGKRFLGTARGPNMHFPSLGGQRRADKVQVDALTAFVSTLLLHEFMRSWSGSISISGRVLHRANLGVIFSHLYLGLAQLLNFHHIELKLSPAADISLRDGLSSTDVHTVMGTVLILQ